LINLGNFLKNMDNYFKDKNVLLTGGAGFLGSFVDENLKKREAKTFIPRSKEWDLRDYSRVRELFNETKPDIVIHLAVDGGGIGYMREHPGSVFYNNLMMNTNLVECSRLNNLEKFVGIGTVCSYPKFTSVPFKEKNLWEGYPEETNAPYGLAKKMMMVQTQGYKEQYGLNGIHLLLVNLYGPRDDFDPKSSHVIPALIKKFDDAIKSDSKYVEVWGTGSASREFLYVEDAAEGIILATERYNESEPVNLGSGMEISIKDLVTKISDLMGFEGEIIWDKTKPDGQPRRCLDVSKAYEKFGFKAKTTFDEGLKKSINWYKNK